MCVGVRQKLVAFKSQIKESLQSKEQCFSLWHYQKVFNFSAFCYEGRPRQKIAISMSSIKLIARLLEIVQVALALQNSKESITKRNLYYKLISYYSNKYYLVDSDIELLSCNTGITRDQMNIVSSSRCLVFGNLRVTHSHGTIYCNQQHITSITTHLSQFTVETGGRRILLIVEKESALYHIHQQLLKRHRSSQQTKRREGEHETQSKRVEYERQTGEYERQGGDHETDEAIEQMIVVASKGYPDSTTRKIIEALLPLVDEIFYLGDWDIYGVDILLCYTISSGQGSSYFERVKWVQLANLVEAGKLEGELLPQSKEDKIKCIEILERPYFKNIQLHTADSQRGQRCASKLIAWKTQLKNMHAAGTKFQLEALFKMLGQGWLSALLHGNHHL